MAKINNKMNDLEKKVELLENELKDKNQDIRKLTDELEKVYSKPKKNSVNENDFNNCFEENVKLEAAKSALEGEVFKLEQKISDLLNHNQMLKKDIHKLEEENKAKNKELDDWKNKLFGLEGRQLKELEDLRHQMDNYKRHNMDVKDLNIKFSAEKENYENQLDMLRKLLENKDKELDKTYDLLNLRKKELDNLNKEVIEIY